MKTNIRAFQIFFIFILFITLPNLPIVNCIVYFGGDVDFRADNTLGFVKFNHSISSNSIYLQNGLVYVSSLYDIGRVWDILGFSCNTSNAKMIIDSITFKTIQYSVTVNETKDVLTHIHSNEFGQPAYVKMGAETYYAPSTNKNYFDSLKVDSWYYDSNSKTTYVKTTDNFPAEVTVSWESITQSGWSSGTSPSTTVDGSDIGDGGVTPVPKNWGLGIVIIIGTLGIGLVWSELNSKKRKKGDVKTFTDKSSRTQKGSENLDKKKKRKEGPDEFKRKAR